MFYDTHITFVSLHTQTFCTIEGSHGLIYGILLVRNVGSQELLLQVRCHGHDLLKPMVTGLTSIGEGVITHKVEN